MLAQLNMVIDLQPAASAILPACMDCVGFCRLCMGHTSSTKCMSKARHGSACLQQAYKKQHHL